MAATTTARKSAAKKTAAAAPRPRVVKPRSVASEAIPDAVEGVVLDADRAPAPVDVFPIFAIGSVQYYAPVRPRAQVELTYLYKLRHENEYLAGAYLVEELVGHDGYVALMNYEALTATDLEQIFTLLREAVQGAAMAGPKDKLRIA